MIATQAIPITENNDVKRVFELLESNGMTKERQNVASLVNQIDFMEKQFSLVIGELQQVKSQLQSIQDKTLRATTTRIVNNVEVKINDAKNRFIALKDSVIQAFSDTVKAVKQKGVSALKKGLDFIGVRSVLLSLQKKTKESMTALHSGITRIEGMKGEINSAKTHIQNAGRAMRGKEVKEITVKGADRGVLSCVQKLFGKTGNLLSGIGQKAGAVIEKIDNLGQRDEKQSVSGTIKNIKKSRADNSNVVIGAKDLAR